MVNRILAAAAFVLGISLATATASFGAGKSFDFKDPKGVNTVIVTIDSLLEPVAGMASGVTGTIEFDPENPAKTTGKILVDAGTLQFVNERYTATALGSRGIDAENHPQLVFTIDRVKEGRETAPGVFTGTVLGSFTCRGVTKPVEVPVTATYLKGRARDRNRRTDGDLLILRTAFKINRTDYGVAQGTAAALVAEEIEIRAQLTGMALTETPTAGGDN